MDEAAILREHEDGQRRVLAEVHGDPTDPRSRPMSDLGAFAFDLVSGMNRALATSIRPPRIVTDSITTASSRDVAKIVDQITDDPARFAVRYLTLETLVFRMNEQLSGLVAREVL